MCYPDDAPDRFPGSGTPPPSSVDVPPARDLRPRRFYPIDHYQTYSLQDAARALAVPEGTLRRAILLDELSALGVDDDRHYVLDGGALQDFVRHLRPAECCVFPAGDSLWLDLALLLLIPLLILLVVFLTRNPEAFRAEPPAGSTPPADCIPGDSTGGSREPLTPDPRTFLREPDRGTYTFPDY